MQKHTPSDGVKGIDNGSHPTQSQTPGYPSNQGTRDDHSKSPPQKRVDSDPKEGMSK